MATKTSNKKPASKPSKAGKAKKEKPVSKANGNNGTATKGGDAPKTTTPIVRRQEVQLLRIADRIRKFADKLKRYENTEITDAVKAADLNLREAVALLKALPDTAGRRAPTKSELSVGTVVSIRENKRASYEDLIEPDDLVGLTVFRIKGTRIACNTKSGQRLFLLRKEIIVDTASAA